MTPRPRHRRAAALAAALAALALPPAATAAAAAGPGTAPRGGGSCAPAPTVATNPPVTARQSVRAGRFAYWRLLLAPGQVLNVQAQVRFPAGYRAGAKDALTVKLLGPDLQPVDCGPASRTALRGLTVPVARVTCKVDSVPETGSYYLAAGLTEPPRAFAGRAAGLTVAFAAGGTPRADTPTVAPGLPPAGAAVPGHPLPSRSMPPSAAAAPGPALPGGPAGNLLWPAGTLVAALAAGYAGMAVLQRRRRRPVPAAVPPAPRTAPAPPPPRQPPGPAPQSPPPADPRR